MATLFKKQSKVKDQTPEEMLEDEEDQELDFEPTSSGSKDVYRQRVLMLSSRGIVSRHRHLMQDLEALMPHCKKDSKLDTKSNLSLINELAELNNCNNCVFFEARKGMDLYMWIAKTPNGPSAKFHVQNIHTMDELKLTGNCLKGSRPIISFDASFETQPHFKLLKEMFTQIFAVPKSSRKTKPFIDHVTTLSIVDDRIWFRTFQIVNKDPTADSKAPEKTNLIEVGPRFCLNLIRIFEGSFGGPTLFENKEFVSPNQIRASFKFSKASKYVKRKVSNHERAYQMAKNKLPIDPMDKAFG